MDDPGDPFGAVMNPDYRPPTVEDLTGDPDARITYDDLAAAWDALSWPPPSGPIIPTGDTVVVQRPGHPDRTYTVEKGHGPGTVWVNPYGPQHLVLRAQANTGRPEIPVDGSNDDPGVIG